MFGMANRTINPLHFEDLEPHRFEDLVRNLLYDFRDWRSIEATGRGGGDDGFDVRAWEKTTYVTNQDEDPELDNIEGVHPMEGNLWMVQCKREKHLGPTRIQEIIRENISANDPPYGFVLVAPANFSKRAYDVFRYELRALGVMEFYLWGKAELEDMLFLPKNDRILFAFMGVSLVSKKRSITADVKFSLNNKNKLLRVLNGGSNNQRFSQSILIRDIFDQNYPYKSQYPDFEAKPRWREAIAWGFDPSGLWVHLHEYYGNYDSRKKSLDYMDAVDILRRESDELYDDEEESEKRHKLHAKVADYWEHLPRKNQARLCIDGLLPYKEMRIIDDKGDIYHNYPHIYVDGNSGVLKCCLFRNILKLGEDDEGVDIKDDMSLRTSPSSIPEIKKGIFHKDKLVEWDQGTINAFRNYHIKTLFDIDHKYTYLNPRDIIRVNWEAHNKERVYLRVTHKYETTVAKYLKEMGEFQLSRIEEQVGRKVKPKERLTVFEIRNCYHWESE